MRRARSCAATALPPRAARALPPPPPRPPAPPARVDLRSAGAFAARHARGSAHIPMEELAARLYELPPPFAHAPEIALVGESEEQLGTATELLTQKGWRVGSSVVAAEDEGWDVGAGAEMVSGGEPSVLWEPNEFLRGLMEDAGAREAVARAGECCESESPIAVDAGCGNGRDAVYLALALGPAWTVYAIDNHKGALARTAELAERSGVADRVVTDARNLRAKGLSGLPRPALLHGHRFLDKPLLEAVAADGGAALGPHGVLMWGHFLEGCEVFAPPRRKSVQLERGWLRSLCAPPHWNVFEDREAQLSTRNETVPAESFAAARTK